MGRPASITLGGTTDGVRVEHVKGRGLVRLSRSTAGASQDDVVGMEVSDFCSRLGITTDVLSGDRRFLLVADPSRPGVRHVIALFRSEAEARTEFVRFRRSERAPGAWAEVLDITRDARRICWFGGEEGPGSTEEKGRWRMVRARLSYRPVWGSRASRKALPTKLTASTVTRMASPGA